jgi:tetratricopeptide (TPR) repeat protein
MTCFSRTARWLTPLLLVFLMASPALAQDTQYGETTFPNSGDAAAQEAFMEGLLMLHSFEYVSARNAFQRAQEVDPDFAMAVWGEAMTHNHPVWMEQDRAAAVEALETLGATPEQQLAAAPTERETHYLRTLHVLYGVGNEEPRSKEARDDAYAEAMAELADAYPDDLNAQSFHALSILGTAHEGRDFATYMRAAAIVEEVFDKNPQHPGAAHYLIHAYDDPVHAPLGLRPARVYADIAPAASHALHMPSHIFFALGMWDEGAASNVDSYEAAKATTERRGEPLNGHGYHALQWWAYARAQQGQYDAARQVVERGMQHAWASDGIATGYERYIQSRFPAMYVIETQRWSEMASFDLNPDAMRPADRISVHAVQGMAALETGDRAAAEAALSDAQAAATDVDPDNRLPAMQLDALLRLDAGDTAAGLARLDSAAAIEDAQPLSFGPADPLKPTHELYGEVLLELDRPAEAQRHFEQALERYPGRALSVWGRAQAAMQAGHAEAAAEARAMLQAMWDDADATVQQRLQQLSADTDTPASGEAAGR